MSYVTVNHVFWDWIITDILLMSQLLLSFTHDILIFFFEGKCELMFIPVVTTKYGFMAFRLNWFSWSSTTLSRFDFLSFMLDQG